MSKNLDMETHNRGGSVKMKVDAGFMNLKLRNTTDASKAPQARTRHGTDSPWKTSPPTDGELLPRLAHMD